MPDYGDKVISEELFMSKKLSRMESNKEVRRVLNRHLVDLAYCQYSCCGMDVKLSGWLCKVDGSDFIGPQIESIVKEFNRLLPGYTISGDFDNWSFNSERISFVGERGSHGSGDQELENTVYEIDLDDYSDGEVS
jgi:hypothetical protein